MVIYYPKIIMTGLTVVPLNPLSQSLIAVGLGTSYRQMARCVLVIKFTIDCGWKPREHPAWLHLLKQFIGLLGIC